MTKQSKTPKRKKLKRSKYCLTCQKEFNEWIYGPLWCLECDEKRYKKVVRDLNKLYKEVAQKEKNSKQNNL